MSASSPDPNPVAPDSEADGPASLGTSLPALSRPTARGQAGSPMAVAVISLGALALVLGIVRGVIAAVLLGAAVIAIGAAWLYWALARERGARPDD